MSDYLNMSYEELQEEYKKLQIEYENIKKLNLNLDMSRGKPCKEQLDLSMGLFDNAKDPSSYISEDGFDCRNYGYLSGIPEAKRLFSQLLGVKESEVIIGGNSSLNLMYDTVARAMFFGVCGSEKPWMKYEKIKFLCPSPGYDRHFAITEAFGVEMIPVEMKEDGPDMDTIEKLVAEDETIKGIWCTPQYSNPDGITYSDEVVDRFARMKTKASDFRIFWDNAYCVHHLYDDDRANVKNILTACKEAGNGHRVFIFFSTSKITHPGAGISVLASSEKNIEFTLNQISKQTICSDKLNQLRHVNFLKSVEGINELMKKHAAIIRPKFEAVDKILHEKLDGKNIARWTNPKGGYFISFFTLDGCARRVEELAKGAGLTLTKAGATYPYGNNPRDNNLRIAPTLPPIEELKKAMEILAVCVKVASIEKLLGKAS